MANKFINHFIANTVYFVYEISSTQETQFYAIIKPKNNNNNNNLFCRMFFFALHHKHNFFG